MYLANEAYDSEDGGTGHGQSQPQVITLRGHPNLVTLYQAFETPSSTILLLEYIAGINLHDFVFESIRLSEGVARGLFRQLVSAVSFCHARGVVHRDLKMSGGWLVKLVDFGLGSSFDPQEYRHTAVGSPGYFAPEIALGAEYVGPEVDVWSCGVVLFEMTTGMHPFSAKDLPTLKEIVVRGRFAVPHHVSPELRRTFARLMNTDASRRKNLHVLDVDAWTNVGY
ncbi:kinase-like domain-containing protein, partial [Catenaria anguillulae PL171]